MGGLGVVLWKELNDNFSSKRFFIMFLIICFVGIAACYISAQNLRGSLEEFPTEQVFLRLFVVSGESIPSFASFLAFFAPLLGVIFGFDAINSEFSQRTVSRILAQPLHRDAWINGKFLAAFVTLAIMLTSIVLIIIGLGIAILGFPPDIGELARIGLFLGVSVVYVGFWLALGVLFSILLDRTVSSALASIAVWIFFSFFIYMLAGVIADKVVPLGPKATVEAWVRHSYVKDLVLRFSPTTIFNEAISAILIPTYRGLGLMALLSGEEIPSGPLSIGQSLLVVWPQLTVLFAMALICFAISYAVFMRREIRT
ncbi:MAG: ABC transporter [Deltaproteobacteria bacterium]|nr:MAG: ABC transporter [Deltaproteobacteria bacterium]